MAPDRPGQGPSSGDRDPEHGAADDATLAEVDQTAADADQTASDTDQTSADRDQDAADRDQEASDRDADEGGQAAEVHAESQEDRDRSTRERQSSATTRLDAAASRDETAAARDQAADARDQAADALDHEIAAGRGFDATAGESAEGARILLRAFDTRRRSAAARKAAAQARESAAADRARAAHDRKQAAQDRRQAAADRETLLALLSAAETDALTGARTRGPGLADLDHEIDRARRSSTSLVVAYIDVVGLKKVNDAGGHAAGDALLKSVVDGVRAQLRSYDDIVRVGGDEFLCVVSGATLADAEQRFGDVEAALSAGPDHAQISVGLAALDQDDTAGDLIARADAELSDRRTR